MGRDFYFAKLVYMKEIYLRVIYAMQSYVRILVTTSSISVAMNCVVKIVLVKWKIMTLICHRHLAALLISFIPQPMMCIIFVAHHVTKCIAKIVCKSTTHAMIISQYVTSVMQPHAAIAIFLVLAMVAKIIPVMIAFMRKSMHQKSLINIATNALMI